MDFLKFYKQCNEACSLYLSSYLSNCGYFVSAFPSYACLFQFYHSVMDLFLFHAVKFYLFIMKHSYPFSH